ncbi:MAG: SpoIID/LytB domain-containing protein [Bacteroidota bacterium]
MSKRLIALSTVIALVSVYVSFFRTPSTTPPPSEEIRVRILEQHSPRALTIHAAGQIELLNERGTPTSTITHDPLSAVQITRQRGQLRITAGGQNVTASGAVVHASTSALSVAAEHADIQRAYQGKLVVYPDPSGPQGLYVVNHVGMDDYVAAVVIKEYGPHHIEGMKAMSVVARTYAMRKLDPTKPYDVVDHQGDQVYKGLEGVTADAKQAAQATAGQVLTHDGALINAVHFASSGGHTANNEDVWIGGPQPYLRGKRDPYDQGPDYITWNSSIGRTQLLNVLSNHVGERVTSVSMGPKSVEGRVMAMQLELANGQTTEMPGTQFRAVVTRSEGIRSLRSTLFVMQKSGSSYLFEGRGFGHGVGLSQVGARTMAEQGRLYEDILMFYYTDVRLEGRQGAATLAQATVPAHLPPEIANDPFLRMEMEGRIGNGSAQSDIYSPAEVHAQRYSQAPQATAPAPPRRAAPSRRSGW